MNFNQKVFYVERDDIESNVQHNDIIKTSSLYDLSRDFSPDEGNSHRVQKYPNTHKVIEIILGREYIISEHKKREDADNKLNEIYLDYLDNSFDRVFFSDKKENVENFISEIKNDLKDKIEFNL